jgi:NitT/TauT family transport system ATP-binding protein
MGTSGQGKTTLLRILLGLEQPDSGHITGMVNKRKSVVFQEDRLCENLSAAANIRLVCNRSIKTGGLIEAMAAVGLAPECAKQTARSMSGGQRRRVAILRALMAEYDVLFMDEPFKGLDEATKERVMLYTKERSRGKTVIFVTHDKTECEVMGGKLINMRGA